MPKHRGVSTAEKRALVGDDWPDCECHDRPMRWNKEACGGAGGFFYCAVTASARFRKWYAANAEATRARSRKWHRENPELARQRQARRVFIGACYIGTERQIPGGREAVAPLVEEFLRFKEAQAAERRSFAKGADE